MTKAERRVRDFSSGMKRLGDGSRNYIQNLTRVLFLVEQPPVCPPLGNFVPEMGDQDKPVTKRERNFLC